MSPQDLKKFSNFRDFLFAELGLREGLISDEDLARGQNVLEEMSQFGIRTNLLSVLVDRRIMDRDSIREIVSLFADIELPCAHCREPVSLRDLNSEGRLRCAKCHNLNGFELIDALSQVPGKIEGNLAGYLKSVALHKDGAASVSDTSQFGHDTSIGGKDEEKPRTPARRPRKTPAARAGGKSSSTPVSLDGFCRAPAPGASLVADIKRFEVLEPIGSGPHGRSYLARRVKPAGRETDLSLKVLPTDLGFNSKNYSTLKDRLSFWSSLSSDPPNPPHFFEREKEAETYYFVRPFLPPPFRTLHETRGLDISQRQSLLCAVAARLAEVHEAEWIHGNLKPSNIFFRLDEDGGTPSVMIVDPALHLLSPSNEGMGRWRYLARAPRYLSPEAIRGEELEQSSDIYALGWIFFEILSGAPPFRNADAHTTLGAHLQGPCPELPEESGHWRSLVLWMTAVDPSERPRQAKDVLRQTEAIVAGKHPKIPKVTPRSEIGTGGEREARRDASRPLARSRLILRYSVAPALMLASLAWVGFCFLDWRQAQAVLSGSHPETRLFHAVAEQAFREARAEALSAPEKSMEIWDEYLRLYSNTPMEGAARAEQRNFRSANGARPAPREGDTGHTRFK